MLPTADVPGELVAGGGLLAAQEKPRRPRTPKKELVVIKPSAIGSGGLRFGNVAPGVIEEKVEPKVKKPKAKNDPQLVAAARELKDRWLEQVNADLYLPSSAGKYDVSRMLEQRRSPEKGAVTIRALPAPIAA